MQGNNSLFDLSDKTALITGGSRGIGFSIALGFAQAGARVNLVATRRNVLDAAVSRLIDEGCSAKGYALDVSDGKRVDQLHETLKSENRLPDIVVNSAGTIARGAVTEISDEEFNHVLDVNVTAMLRMARAFTPNMRHKGFGRIINISSIAALGGMVDRTSYCSSKAAVVGFTQSLATEMAASGVTVNAISPGSFPTEFNKPLQTSDAFQAWMDMKTPLKRWGLLEEIAGPAVFLASEASSYVTGHNLVVDGGTSATI